MIRNIKFCVWLLGRVGAGTLAVKDTIFLEMILGCLGTSLPFSSLLEMPRLLSHKYTLFIHVSNCVICLGCRHATILYTKIVLTLVM